MQRYTGDVILGMKVLALMCQPLVTIFVVERSIGVLYPEMRW